MAFKSIANYPSPLAHFAQSSMAPAPSASPMKPVVNLPNPLAHFAQSSMRPAPGGGNFKPIQPLPGVAVSGGSYGFPM